MRSLLFAAVVMVAAVMPVTPAFAQQRQEPLSDLLPNMLFESIIGNFSILSDLSRQPVTIPDSAFHVPAQINDLLGAQLVAFPVSSSAGGFAWSFNPSIGTLQRESESFGPLFAERPLTIGRNRLNVGATFQRVTFDALEDRSLRNDEIKFYTGVTGVPGLGTVFIEDALDLQASANIIALFATYGLTNRLDVGVAVPIMSVSLKAQLQSRIGIGTTVGEVFFTDNREGSATGIGDTLVRAKYNVWPLTGGGLAAGVDFRLPTGDEANLLGLGGGQAKMYVAAAAGSRVAPHMNFGYTFSWPSDYSLLPDTNVYPPKDEISYAGGVDVALTRRVTVAGDLVGRTLRDFERLREVTSVFGAQFREFELEDGNVHVLLGSVGGKFNVWGNNLVTGNVLFPLNKTGLRDHLTWVVGFEQSF